MARVTVKPTVGARLRVTARVEKILKDPVLLKEVKDFSINRIVSTARLGKSMEGSQSGRGRALPKLSKSYIEQRKKKTRGIDGEFFQRNAVRSNWTLSGQFLKSIKGQIIRSGRLRGRVALFPSGRRKDGNKNIQILRWLTAYNKRYEIFALNKSAQKQIGKIVQRFLRRKLRNR